MLKKILLVLALWVSSLCFGLVFIVIFVNATIR